jgi:N-acetyl-1-D-myo-inositol-2-amino-2-deoxy-alpha-D-glucopyranoside deacetylase
MNARSGGGPGGGGLLVVTAHPDDETLIAGGTLAACAAAGVPTGVVCLTRGELGPISNPALATPETLGAVRVQELHAACAELGVGFVRCYRRPDSHLEWLDLGAIGRQLAEVIEERAPDAVITFGEEGLYWHPDHIAALACARRALARLSHPPTLYCAALPAKLMPELIAALHDRGEPTDLWGIDPGDFGDSDLDDAIALDITPFVPQKLRALRCHRTQVGEGHALASIPADLADRFLGTEWFVPHGASNWLRQTVARGQHRA